MTSLSNRRMRLPALMTALAVALVTALALPGRDAQAHPLGNFTTNRYVRIELYEGQVHLHYVLDVAEIPTFQLVQRIDTDGDGDASEAELATWATERAASLPAGMELAVDGEGLPLEEATRTATFLPGEGGLDVTRLAVVYTADVPDGTGTAVVSVTDSNYTDGPGWRELVVLPSAGTVSTVDAALLTDRSDALRVYPEADLRSAPDVRAATFAWNPASGAGAPALASVEAAGEGRNVGGFSSLLGREQSATVVLLSLLAALGFGALHALGPGHGKSVVAAYLVGSRGTVRHAVALGATVTATHTSTVYLLGFITLTASAFIVPERLYLYLGVGSGVMVLLMGAALVASRVRQLRRPADSDSHRHGWLGKAHSHVPSSQAAPVARWQAPAMYRASDGRVRIIQDSTHSHGHPHAHSNDDAQAHETAAVTWKGLLTLGIAGGMMPCPSAIVVMLAAISIGQVALGMLLIVAFSLGLAGVLTGIGIALVVGRRLSGHFTRFRPATGGRMAKVATVLPLLSAAGVTMAGLFMTLQALQQKGL